MTDKKHCDVCDQVIEGDRVPTATVELLRGTKMAIEVDTVTAYRGSVHICLYCALAALNAKDKRPRDVGVTSYKEQLRWQLPRLVDRFLAWPVPNTELADPCASSLDYVTQHPESRTGTNFFSTVGAKAMLTDVLELDHG